MGNLVANNQISISIQKPTATLFDFNKQSSEQSNKMVLSYPSFIKNSDNVLQYSQRCKFTQREYEIDYQKNNGERQIVFRKQMTTNSSIWRALSSDERVSLQEGSIIKLADKEFTIKKICQHFNDLDGFEENIKTLSDIDITDAINLANSCFKSQQSRYLKRSQKHLPKVQSLASLIGDGQFCRVCFSSQMNDRNPLLNLCKCSGSIKNIHYLCLKRWINTKSKHISCGTYEYFEYDLSCDLCKQKIDKIILHKDKKYVVYSESLIHPPFIVMAYKSDMSNKVRQYIINFDHKSTVLLGKSKDCDLPLSQRLIGGQHCELIYEKNILYLKNLNPTFGTFVNFSQADISGHENSIKLMINNHLIKLLNESMSCLTSDHLKIRVEDYKYNNN